MQILKEKKMRKEITNITFLKNIQFFCLFESLISKTISFFNY